MLDTPKTVKQREKKAEAMITSVGSAMAPERRTEAYQKPSRSPPFGRTM